MVNGLLKISRVLSVLAVEVAFVWVVLSSQQEVDVRAESQDP